MSTQDSDKSPDSAIALQYDGVTAPRVTAKGEGELANKIIELANEWGIPLHEDPDLVMLLSRLELGDEIPEALYIAVAQVIAFTYVLTGKFPKDYNK